MKKIHFYISTGFATAEYNDIVEFDDNVTEEELDEYLDEFVNSHIYAS